MTSPRTHFEKTFHFVEKQISSPLRAQLLEFCESDVQNSVTSSSNRCYQETSLMVNNGITTCTATIPTITTTGNDFSLMFVDKITPRDPFSNEDQFDLSLLQNQISLTNDNIAIKNHVNSHPCFPLNDHVVPIMISPMPPSKLLLPNNTLSSNYRISTKDENNLLLGNDIQIQELEFQGDNTGNFYIDHLPHSYTSKDLKAFDNENQHVVTPLTSEIMSSESEYSRVSNKLTSEERKEKINKYMKKRNERNFNKKIKYVCRKTLADSRPRVRGRFAKHDDFLENNKTNNRHEDYADGGEQNLHEAVKEEEENLESLDILAHISGVNSFKWSYPIQSWI